MRATTNRNGIPYYIATINELEEMDADNEGYCYSCGDVNNIEPDAWKCTCPGCGKHALCGAAEYVCRGIYD